MASALKEGLLLASSEKVADFIDKSLIANPAIGKVMMGIAALNAADLTLEAIETPGVGSVIWLRLTARLLPTIPNPNPEPTIN
ncbi:MAG: hypothetical protein H7249_13955 [Chitinophagaceae bacterium]|nr:hypothetical protein [Oligoflexus sp.]